MYADVSPFSNRPPYFRYRTRSYNPQWSHLMPPASWPSLGDVDRAKPQACPAKCTDGACWGPGISMIRFEKLKLVIVYFIIYIHSLRLDMFVWHHLTIDHLTIKNHQLNSCLHQIDNPCQNKVRQHSSRNNKTTPQRTMPTGFWQDLLFSVPLCFSPGFFSLLTFRTWPQRSECKKTIPQRGQPWTTSEPQ